MNNINHWHASNDQSATRLSLMDYSGLNPAQVSTGGLIQAELELGELSLSLVLSSHLLQHTRSPIFSFLWAHR